jgi:hypothetical protein
MSATVSALLLAWIAILVLVCAQAGFLRILQRLSHEVISLRELVTDVTGSVAGTLRELTSGLPAPEHLRRHLSLGEQTLVVFGSDACPGCEALLPLAAVWANDDAPPSVQRRLLKVFRRLGASEDDDAGLDSAEAEALFERFGVTTTPYLVFVGPSGVIAASGPVSTSAAFHQMAARVERVRDLDLGILAQEVG